MKGKIAGRVLAGFLVISLTIGNFPLYSYANESISDNTITIEEEKEEKTVSGNNELFGEEDKPQNMIPLEEKETEAEGETEIIEIQPEETVSGNEIRVEDNSVSENDLKTSTPPEEHIVVEYDDVFHIEEIIEDPEQIEGTIYDADELIAMAENMPAFLSESYGAYWDNYSNYYIYNQLTPSEQKLWDALEIICSLYLHNEVDIVGSRMDYVRVDDGEFDENTFWDIIWAFKYSHPEYYYILNHASGGVGSDYAIAAFYVYDAFAN